MIYIIDILATENSNVFVEINDASRSRNNKVQIALGEISEIRTLYRAALIGFTTCHTLRVIILSGFFWPFMSLSSPSLAPPAYQAELISRPAKTNIVSDKAG